MKYCIIAIKFGEKCNNRDAIIFFSVATTYSDNPLVPGCSFEIKKQGYFDFPTSAYKLL